MRKSYLFSTRLKSYLINRAVALVSSGGCFAFVSLGLIASSLHGAETGLVGYWKMDETRTTTVVDSSGAGNNGKLLNASSTTSWVPGQVNGAVSLDGVNDVISVPSSNTLNVGSAFTLAAWVFPRIYADTRILNRGTNTTSMYDLALADGGALTLRSSSTYTTQKGLIQLFVWQQVTVTYDGTMLRFYVQGVQQASAAISLSIADSTDSLYIGNLATLKNGLLGQLDEVRVYNRALSAAEVQVLCGTNQASIQLDSGTVYQTISGWEVATLSWETNKVNNNYDPTWVQYAPQVCDRLANEMGISRVRLELKSGSENPTNRWELFTSGKNTLTDWDAYAYEKINDDNDPYHANLAGFQFGHFDFEVENTILPLKAALEAKGEKLYINVNYTDFNWTTNKGTLSHATNPEEYAEFILVYFDHLRTKYGLIPDGLEMLLEPDNSDGWTGPLLGQAVVTVVNRLHAAGYDPEIIAPSCSAPANAVVFYKSLVSVSGVKAYVNTFSYHRYGTNFTLDIANAAAASGIRTAMLEWVDAVVTDFLDDILIGNVSAWNQWGIGIRNTTNMHYLYSANLTDPANPVFEITTNMKPIQCYTKFVRPGAIRIGATSSGATNSTPAAFINADGNYVLVLQTGVATANPVAISGLQAGTYGVRNLNSSLALVNSPDLTVQTGVPVMLQLSAGVTTIYGKNPPAATPDIEVRRESILILDGNTDRVDGAAVGAPLGLSYQLENHGSLPLTLGIPTITRLVNCVVSVTNPSSTVAPGYASALHLSVTPNAEGPWSCEISLATNDRNENPAHWWLAGTASITPMPEIHLTRGRNPVINTFTEKVEDLHVGETSPLIYKLSNLGSGELSVGTASIASAVNCVAEVKTAPAGSVAVGTTTTLEILVTPIATGDWSYTVSLSSNDENENPTTWTSVGMAVAGTESLSAVSQGTAVLNASTGHYEQKVTVTNNGSEATGGFEFLLKDVPNGVTVVGGVHLSNSWTISYPTILEKGKSIQVVVPFAASSNPGVFTPAIALVAAPPSPSTAHSNFSSSIIPTLIEGKSTVVLDFPTAAGRRYQVEYSDDLGSWLPASANFIARSTMIEWKDDGKQTGGAAPTAKSKRFYRIRDLTVF